MAKYVADGFVIDSEKLLSAFVQENSTNFTVFATKWKEHNFGLIFSGRDKQDLQQFTHEIYQLTLEYLQNTSFILQIGAVYLLYALYRNQLSIPPVRIRIKLQQWEIIKKLRVLAQKNCYMHLHYIINFLFSNSLDFVAHPILHGPCTSRGKMPVEKPTLHTTYFSKDCKAEMSNLLRSNLLEEMRDLSKEYKDLQAQVLPSGSKEVIDVSDIKEYINCLENIVQDGPYSRKKFRNKAVDINVGTRRANIKANQFERKALFRQLNPSDSDEDYEPLTEIKEKQAKRYAKKRRLPKFKRKVGRPKKYDLEKMLESDGNDSECTKPLYPTRRGPSSKSSYLEKYEFKIPAKTKMLKNLFTDTSEEKSSSDSEETKKVKSEVLSDSENQNDNFEDQEDNSEGKEDNPEGQENNMDDAISDVSDSDSYTSHEVFDLCF